MRKRNPFRPVCPYCSGNRIHRHGRTAAGTQRYRCLPCNRTFIRRTGSGWHRLRLRLQFLRYMKLMPLGNPVRMDARLLAVSPSTVWRWRHNLMARLVERERPPELPHSPTALMTHTLLPRRRYWGNLGNYPWANRNGLDYLGERLMQHTHPQHCTSLTFVSSRTEQGNAAFAVLTHSGDAVLPSLFTGTGQGEEAHQITGTWAVPLSGDGAKSIPLHIVLCDPAYRCLDAARRNVLKLKTIFHRWTARFRGVALRHLPRYAAWFNALLANGALDRLHPGKPLRWIRA